MDIIIATRMDIEEKGGVVMLDLICLHTVEWFQIFLSNTNNSI